MKDVIQECAMRLMSQITEKVDFVFDLVWGLISIGIIALAIGIAAYKHDSHTTIVASNSVSETTLPPIEVQGVR
jgi:hypothetical protein